MQGDLRPVPLAALLPLGTAGASFLTSWLPAALDSARTMRQVEGVLRLAPPPCAADTPVTTRRPACDMSGGMAPHAAGLTKQAEAAEEDEYREIEGVLVGPGGFAVAEDGTVLPVSKLTVPALRAELIARGLSTDGKRRDMYRRVQVQRLFPSPSPHWTSRALQVQGIAHRQSGLTQCAPACRRRGRQCRAM